MNALPAIAPVNLLTVAGGIGAVDASSSLLATTGLAAFDTSSTIVELSGLGQLASALASYQTNLAGLQTGQGFGNDAAGLAAEAQYFVDAFNGLQNTMNGLAGPGGALAGGVLPGQVATALNSQATATYDNGGSALTSLAQIGIGYAPSQTAGGGGGLTLDIATLESAFQQDANGAFSLLAQAASAFSSVAASFAARAGAASSSLGTTASDFVEQSLLADLLAGGVGLAGTTTYPTLDLLTLLALESPYTAGNTSPSLIQQIVALNQFSLVSSLLG